MIPIEELKQKPREHTLPTEGLLMIPIEELKLNAHQANRCHHPLLMIPIEELKLNCSSMPAICKETFDDTYWGIETALTAFPVLLPTSFWWYLLRNWNLLQSPWQWHRARLLMIPIEELKHHCSRCSCQPIIFWWYLLRNWNSAMDATAPTAFAFDDTYWGIETLTICNATVVFHLLMIPIEELKRLCESLRAGSAPFWWYLLRNWNFFCFM